MPEHRLPCGAALSRRWLLRASGTLPLATLSACAAARLSPRPAGTPAASMGAAPRGGLADVEREIGGRLGVAALDTESGARLELRANERFAMCSTFKLVLAAATLARVDARQEQLDRRIQYDEAALLEYAPVTRAHLAEGAMSVEALCRASVTLSDNTAANLLLEALGGPPALTAYFRSLGDGVSRLDRNEPMLNTALDGDERDTTTPAAMLATMWRILLGDALSPPGRALCIEWLITSTTGLERLRAGLPSSFRAGDKTGTGANGATCDVAIAWPKGRAPLLIAAYFMGSSASPRQLNAALARVAAVVVAELGLG